MGGKINEPIYPSAVLDSEEVIAVFLVDALETGDAAFIVKAMGVVARAKGMNALANETGLSREPLYCSFSEQGNPTLKTLLAIMKALGADLTARPHQAIFYHDLSILCFDMDRVGHLKLGLRQNLAGRRTPALFPQRLISFCISTLHF